MSRQVRLGAPRAAWTAGSFDLPECARTVGFAELLGASLLELLAQDCDALAMGSLPVVHPHEDHDAHGSRHFAPLLPCPILRQAIQAAARLNRRSPETIPRETVTAQLAGGFLINMF
ncbi:hypothetical protein QA649_20820 [Bradyrhizobium sp. CB1717]|uniref:hypothetical protein n=1 Tax=Bradyrhizobium sp. CB1717 TaxID=3039154 RepID=UPI0024B0FBF6|nr:hypothetical protein [Bradyrhizobium sp. CB1717]WFU28574.1 hypothetical protein QA649_20820 [Bradyrhizobium sp. CB1717]